eukprot:2815287-Amphidinium_carterae.1
MSMLKGAPALASWCANKASSCKAAAETFALRPRVSFFTMLLASSERLHESGWSSPKTSGTIWQLDPGQAQLTPDQAQSLAPLARACDQQQQLQCLPSCFL